MKTTICLAFQNTRYSVFQTEEEERFGQQMAVALADAIKAEGANCLSDTPVYEIGGWLFKFTFNDQRMNFFLNVANLKSLESESWCLALIPRPNGILRNAKPVPRKLVDLVETSLKKIGAIKLNWWTTEEFEREL